ncbi:hypothetical protein NLJ89_g11673 [Agrocybe chaxingu]|uniref:Uncharacterized protein n=1 Tax=Agrocybe chaxingu TaxID=84603 RepID=A0A9W8JNA4_9AGAR|nr:hypothetical protein NLJ89_g11673 [Agrocybe chaxingu]
MIKKHYTGAQITQIDTTYHTSFSRWSAKNEEVLCYKEEHNIAIRWVPTSSKYEEGAKLIRERKYQCAIDELERLAVQRLFEMTKLGQNGVGYKLCEKIVKSLKTRVPAIQSALKRYNDATAALDPPRPPLVWETVVGAATLADFDLLRDTRQDIQALDWAQPANCEGMVMYFGIKRAKEELQRLDVEIRRLLAFLLDNHTDHFHAVADTIGGNPPLAHEIYTRWTSRLKGFTGLLLPRECIGHDPQLNEDVPKPAWYMQLLKITEAVTDLANITEMDDEDGEEDDDGVAEHAGTDALVEVMEQATLDDHPSLT